jgi:lipopolysaccharide export system protein LptA
VRRGAFRRLATIVLVFLVAAEASAADDPFTFRGDRLSSSFTKDQERTILTGNASIVSGNLQIAADSIELWGPSFRYASCSGHVVVKDMKKNIVLKSDTMEYDRTLKTSRFQGLCEMEDPSHGVTVRAGLFDYQETSEKMNLQSGVRIFKGDLVCRSDFGVYDRGTDSLELTGLPTVNKKRDLYKAGSIRVNLKTEDVLLDGGVSGTITPASKKTADTTEPPPEATKP